MRSINRGHLAGPADRPPEQSRLGTVQMEHVELLPLISFHKLQQRAGFRERIQAAMHFGFREADAEPANRWRRMLFAGHATVK